MNQKKAKRIRRDLKLVAPDLPKVSYKYENHKARHIPTGKLNADGSPLMVVYTPHTVRLGNCQRKHYQQLKRA